MNLDKMEFLTKIDSSLTIKQLKSLKNSYTGTDNEILENIFQNLEKLTPQEIYYLKNHPQSLWLEYLIFRYKFVEYPKQKIVSNFPIYLLIEPISVCNLNSAVQNRRSLNLLLELPVAFLECKMDIFERCPKEGN